MAHQSHYCSHHHHQAVPIIRRRTRKRVKPLLHRINYQRITIHVLVTFLVCVVLGPLQVDRLLPTLALDKDQHLRLRYYGDSPKQEHGTSIDSSLPLFSPQHARRDWIHKISFQKAGTPTILPVGPVQATTNNNDPSFRDSSIKSPERQKDQAINAMSGFHLATSAQLQQCGNDERKEAFLDALEHLQMPDFRRRVDPLSENNFIQGRPTNRIAFLPKSKYLGILVDAGRHYYPIDWLKRLIHYLYRLRFNMIHLRLTDDQAFNIQLESYPELAMASAVANTTYTATELRDLVAYAKLYDITIIPEVNLPGHSGAWSGIPEMVLHCPQFACKLGYGIPMNVEYDQLKSVLKAVVQEVLEIFDNPPFLHLGKS